MDQLLSLLQANKQGLGLIGLVGIAAYLTWSNWGTVKGYWPFSMFGGGTTKTDETAVPSRREVLDDLDSCYAYFDSIHCQEGMDHISAAVTHAFHAHDVKTDANPTTQLIDAIKDALTPKDVPAPATASQASSDPAPATNEQK